MTDVVALAAELLAIDSSTGAESAVVSAAGDGQQFDRRELSGVPRAREEGLLAGGSSGVAAAASLRIARRLGPDKTVVTIFPDGAERYPGQGIFVESGAIG